MDKGVRGSAADSSGDQWISELAVAATTESMSCLEGRGSPKKKKAVVKKCTVRLTSRQSPLKPIDLSWVPDG